MLLHGQRVLRVLGRHELYRHVLWGLPRLALYRHVLLLGMHRSKLLLRLLRLLGSLLLGQRLVSLHRGVLLLLQRLLRLLGVRGGILLLLLAGRRSEVRLRGLDSLRLRAGPCAGVKGEGRGAAAATGRTWQLRVLYSLTSSKRYTPPPLPVWASPAAAAAAAAAVAAAVVAAAAAAVAAGRLRLCSPAAPGPG